MENKRNVGRPRGYKCSDETKAKISKGMKIYYANMTPKQKEYRDACNRRKGELFRQAWEEYYNNFLNNI